VAFHEHWWLYQRRQWSASPPAATQPRSRACLSAGPSLLHTNKQTRLIFVKNNTIHVITLLAANVSFLYSIFYCVFTILAWIVRLH